MAVPPADIIYFHPLRNTNTFQIQERKILFKSIFFYLSLHEVSVVNIHPCDLTDVTKNRYYIQGTWGIVAHFLGIFTFRSYLNKHARKCFAIGEKILVMISNNIKRNVQSFKIHNFESKNIVQKKCEYVQDFY